MKAVAWVFIVASSLGCSHAHAPNSPKQTSSEDALRELAFRELMARGVPGECYFLAFTERPEELLFSDPPPEFFQRFQGVPDRLYPVSQARLPRNELDPRDPRRMRGIEHSVTGERGAILYVQIRDIQDGTLRLRYGSRRAGLGQLETEEFTSIAEWRDQKWVFRRRRFHCQAPWDLRWDQPYTGDD